MLTLRWISLRLVVGVLAATTVVALGNLTVNLLMLAYSGITPYAGL
ncbi:MAG TPA: hypothetical protein VNM48_17955 [Chloroflexota bacterium]|nr:hypothetical protein [Chloroflexota bacterium]